MIKNGRNDQFGVANLKKMAIFNDILAKKGAISCVFKINNGDNDNNGWYFIPIYVISWHLSTDGIPADPIKKGEQIKSYLT